ncbi:MAG: hypothetical protein H7122_16500 [Chitinophagaceae bacterium]|nr:hypothetical protein [Chitinophagaceae bacterium]
MRKILLVALMFSAIGATAQTVTRKVVLAKGQQLEQQSHVKMNMTQEMMGQSMEIKVESDITNVVEVKDAASNSFEVANTIKKILMNMSAMGQDMKFDSDKKEDMDGQMGQAFKGKIGVPREFTVNKEGIITALKANAEKKDDPGGMMGGMMNGAMGEGEEKEGSSFNSLANIPSKGVKVGESWSDSTSDSNGKTFTTYTLKEVTGGNGLVTLSANTAINRELEQQGMTVQMDMKATTTGEYTFEVGTGIIKTRKATTKATGTMEVAGQSVPVNIETIVQSTISKK